MVSALFAAASLAVTLTAHARYVSQIEPAAEQQLPAAPTTPAHVIDTNLAAQSGAPASGQVIRNANGGLTLAGSSTGVNVFEVDAAALASATSLTVATPPGAKAVMRVTGGQRAPLAMSGTSMPVTTLVHFSGESNPLANQGALPLANVTIVNTISSGPLFANAMDQDATSIAAANDVRARLAVSEPPSFALLLAGFVMLLGIIVRRRRSAL